MFLSNMESLSSALLSYVLLSSVFVSVCDSHDGKCVSLVNSPFNICTTAGYNYTLPFPEKLVPIKREVGSLLNTIITTWHNCSTYSVAAAMECSLMFPKCSAQGKRVYPCRRVCGEFLKHCMNKMDDFRDHYLDFVLSLCLSLPNETSVGDNCFEPPNFTTNDSVPSPLDRGCQKLIFPACKNLGIYSHTLSSESVQKKVYKLVYNKTYSEHDLEERFPRRVEQDLVKYSKCRRDLEKLFCGEMFPPCFPEEANPVLKTLCRSVCDDIARDCPGFFSRHFMDTEFCGTLTEGETSHRDGFCDRKEWPTPFLWIDYMGPTPLPTKEPEKQGPKGWPIAVAVLVTLLVVGLSLAGLIWWKWRGRRAPAVMGYTKQQDETAEEL